MNRWKSACCATGLSLLLVTATVMAPAAFALLNTSIVSFDIPDCDTIIMQVSSISTLVLYTV